MIPKYQTNLTPDEYENCVKHGAAMLMTSARQSGVIKTADNTVGSALGSLSSLGDYSTRLLLTLSVVTGVPAGIMLHTIGKRISERRQADRQIGDEIGYYRNATQGLESEMARQGIKISQALDTVQMLKQRIMAAQQPQHKDNRQPEPEEPKTPIGDDLRPNALEAASKQQEDDKKA